MVRDRGIASVSATGAGPVRVLLVDDDPDQYLLTEELLSDTHDGSWLVTLDWARSFEDGLQRLSAGQHDVALIDYRLGARTGVELLQERDVRRAGIPAIMLTADSRGGTDLEAMAAGAVDYLVKDEVTAPLLKRALRYAVERQRVVTSLLDSEAEYQSAFEEAPVGIAHTSLDGRGLRVNAALRALLGCSTDQFREIDYAGLVHPSDAEASARHRAGLLAGTANRYTAEKRFRRRAGSYFWANVTVSLHRDARGAPKYFITVVEDISQRRQAQQELDHIFNLSPDMLCTANYSGYFIRTNAAWSQALGYSADELKHTPFLDFVHPDDREATQREFERLTAGRTTFNFNNRYRTADGTYRWIEWHSKVDPENQIVYAVARDQTDRHLLEEQLRQAQKMEAVGRLAGGVAHDFNNLLTAILSFAEMTLEQLQPDDPLYLDVQQIQHAGQSAASLTKQLLAFSRMQILEPQIICGNILVGDMEGLLRRVLGEDVELVVSLAAGAD
ncbi:MAG: PAS domain S-box protein, partial [Acidobacteriota bacterium]